MIPYYSYWTAGYKEIDELTIGLTKLSAFFSQKAYGEAHMVTDSKGYEIFKKIYNWTSISAELDCLPKEYGDVWSLGKIKTFEIAALRGAPFFHIDYDVILWSRLPQFIERSDIFCQSREGHVSDWPSTNYIYNLEKPYFLKDKIKPYISPNCGIVGGQDIDFIRKYASSAIDLVLDKSNAHFWLKKEFANDLNYGKWPKHFEKAVLAEQYYLAVSAEKFGKNITYLLDHGSDEECKQKNYTHILGSKKDLNLPYKIKEALKKVGLEK